MTLIEAQIPLILLRVGDHLDLPFTAGRTREPTISSQNRLIPPQSRLPAEPRQNILHGGARDDLFDDVEDSGDGQADPHRHSRPAPLRLLGFVNSGVRWRGRRCGGQLPEVLHRHGRSRATLLVLLDKGLDDVLGPTGLVPAGGRYVQRLMVGVAEALGAGEADIRQRPPPGEAGDDVAHLHLTLQECSGDEHLLPAGLDGDRDALDRTGEGDETQARGSHVPAESKRTAPLRRHECQVVGQGLEDECDGLVEHLPGDRVMSAGPPIVEPGPSELRRPHIVPIIKVVIEPFVLGNVDSPFAVERHDVQGTSLIRGRGIRHDLNITVSACPAEEELRTVGGEGLGAQDVGGVEQEAVHALLSERCAQERGHAVGHLHLGVHGAVHVSPPSPVGRSARPSIWRHRADSSGSISPWGLPGGCGPLPAGPARPSPSAPGHRYRTRCNSRVGGVMRHSSSRLAP